METLRKALDMTIRAIVIGVPIFLLQIPIVSSLINIPYEIRDIHHLCTGEDLPALYSQDYYSQITDLAFQTGVWRFSSSDAPLEVTLIGMSHIASPEFYQDVEAILLEQQLVLLEGIGFGLQNQISSLHPFYLHSMKEREAKGKFYPDVLTPQDESPLVLRHDNWIYADANIEEMLSFIDSPLEILYWTNEYWMSRLVQKLEGPYEQPPTRPDIPLNLRYMAEIIQDMSVNYILYVFICSRNPIPIEALDQVHAQAKESGTPVKVAIPWGISHLPDFIRTLSEKGYTLEEHYYLDVFPLSYY